MTGYKLNGILFSHKKNEILSFAAKLVELEDIILGKINRKQKEKYCIFSLIYRSEKIELYYRIVMTRPWKGYWVRKEVG